jgi:hypothetical protein
VAEKAKAKVEEVKTNLETTKRKLLESEGEAEKAKKTRMEAE